MQEEKQSHEKKTPTDEQEISELIKYIVSKPVEAGIEEFLGHEVPRDSLDEDENGEINCVINKMRFIAFGANHHISINNKKFKEICAKIEVHRKFGYISGELDRVSHLLPYEEASPITVIELKYLVSKHTRILSHLERNIMKLTHRPGYTIGDYTFVWDYRNAFVCNVCVNNKKGLVIMLWQMKNVIVAQRRFTFLALYCLKLMAITGKICN